MKLDHDSDNSILQTHDNKNIQLLDELSPEKPSRYKRALFEFFIINHNSWFKVNLTKIRNISAYCGIGIKQLQFQSLVLLSTTKKTSSYYDRAIQNLLNNIRFDLAFLDFTSQNTLTYISLSVVFMMVLMFSLIYMQLLAKKRLFIKIFIIIFGALSWTIENYLMIPIVIYSTVYIQHSLFIQDSFVSVYDKRLEFDVLLGFFFILQLVFLYVIVIMNTIFNYPSGFSFETAYSRAHSMVSLKQITFLFTLSVMHVAVSKTYFLYMSIVIGLMMVYNYINYLTYYSNFDNLVDSGLWLTLCVSSTLSLINEYIPDGFETVICLIILLPFIYFLLWTGLERSFNQKSVLQMTSPYLYELRIRKVCNKKNTLSEENIETVRKLFNEATKLFLEFKLIYVWECNFELKYCANHDLAMMKLLKMVFSAARPAFLEKPEVVFTSFPDLEAQFLFYKLFKGLSKSSNSRDYSLIKYLKHYSKSSQLDLEACCKLMKLIDCNLESAHLPAELLLKRCIELHLCLSQNELNLSKYMSSIYDEPHELARYKSFKEQLFNSGDPNFESQEERQFENFIDKLMDFNLDHRNAKLILSGQPKRLGIIIYVNRHCVNLLSASSASEVLGKNYRNLIPAPFDKAHEFILERFLLFGQSTEVKRDHLVILDSSGFAIEVTMHFKMAFYCRIPYFVLDLIPKSPKECIILFSTTGEIFSYSQELDPVLKKSVKNLEELFPRILGQVFSHPFNTMFLYKEENHNEIIKCSQFQVQNETLNVLYIYDEEDLNRRKITGINIYNIFRRKSSLISRKHVSKSSAMFRRPSINRRKIKKVESTDSFLTGTTADYSAKILKFTTWLKVLNYFAWFFICLIALTICIVQVRLSQPKTLCDIVNDLGTIKNYVSSVAVNARSIDLYQFEEGLAHSLSYYQMTFMNHTDELERYLLGLDKYSEVFPIKERLKDKKIEVVKYINSTLYPYRTNLYQAILELISSANQWSRSKNLNKDSLLFIYNNAFHTIYAELNSTIFDSSISIRSKNIETFSFFKQIKVLVFIPILLLFTLSLILFIFLSKITKTEWKIISEIPTSSLMFIRCKTNERIKAISQDHMPLNPSVDRRKSLSSKIWKSYFFSSTLLTLLVFCYYFTCFYSLDSSLSFLMDLMVDNRYWGGLRRSLVLKVFIWGREFYLKDQPYSYSETIKDQVKFSSIFSSFEHCRQDLTSIENKILLELIDLKTEGFSYSQDLDLLIDRPCNDLTSVENCEYLMISRGVHLAVHSFNIDMSSLVSSVHQENSLFLSLSEKNSEDLVKSLKLVNDLQEDKSYHFYSHYFSLISLTSGLFILALSLFFKLIQIPVINSIRLSLLSMNQLILLFNDSRMGRSQLSLEETSQHSFPTTLK